ncbi:MAG: hypothetical protein JWS11_2507 [Cypionkella sp.]|nr:hypothetical protein [Cypionkella sp.]
MPKIIICCAITGSVHTPFKARFKVGLASRREVVF